MGKPGWQNWPEEPWSGLPKWPRDADGNLIAFSAHEDRIKSCVNALAGIRNPAGVGEVIRLLKADIKYHPDDVPQELQDALAALDQEPGE